LLVVEEKTLLPAETQDAADAEVMDAFPEFTVFQPFKHGGSGHLEALRELIHGEKFCIRNASRHGQTLPTCRDSPV
jgi:hypothetical protein